ncbi:hypothetical protein [Vulcanococcus limneticus]|uniref:hypothetical protein n=1 Tax=Vulcanococcus limneticus TaxID=2170428 RepID=UPI00398BF522
MTVATGHVLELHDQLRHHAAPVGWVVLVGPLPAGQELGWIQAAAQPGVPVLAILPGLDHGDELKQQLLEEGVEGVTLCSQVLGAEDGDVCWYRYNDARRDGTTSPERLQVLWPNLRLEGLELRPTRRLDAVLRVWLEQAAADASQPGLLWLPATVAPSVLAGAGAFLERLASIWLEGTSVAAGLDTELVAWLEASCHRLERDGPSRQLWRLDGQRLLERRLLVLTQQYEALQMRCEELEVQLSAQTAQMAEQDQQREALQVRVDELQGQLSVQTAQTADQSQQREALQMRCEELEVQLSAQTVQMAEQNQQREALQVRVDELQAQLSAQTAQTADQSQQREALQMRCEELEVQLSAQTAQMAEQNQQREALQMRCEELEVQLSAQTVQMAEQNQQREALQDQNASLQCELEADKLLTLDQASKLREISLQRDALERDKRDLADRVRIDAARIALLLKDRDALSLSSEVDGTREVPSGLNDLTASQSEGSGSEGAQTQQRLLGLHLHASRKSSDKWESYFPVYERIFQGLSRGCADFKLLEIGVQNGGSLEVWRDFFGAGAQIIGVDIDHSVSLLKFDAGVRCLIGDATDPAWAEPMASDNGPFDVIIDDGSHVSRDIVKAFCILFGHLKPSGVYVIEDLHASYFPDYGGGAPGCEFSAMEFFKQIADLINLEHWLRRDCDSLRESVPLVCASLNQDGLTEESVLHICSIEFANSMVVIRKSAGEAPVSLGARIVSPGEAKVCKDTLALNRTRL